MSFLLRTLPATTPEMLAAFGDASLLRAALAFEAALASAEASNGVVSPAYAAAIEAACIEESFDIAALAEAAAHAGTLAIPLVARLRTLVAEQDKAAVAAVHLGATSQDVADTALMLQARAGISIISRDLGALRDDLARLAAAHADTPMVGRTLLQAALPTSFGLKICAWLAGLDDAAFRLAREADTALALQFGGELAEPRMAGRGGSSAMAHKRNPTGCQVALSAAARAPGLAATLLATLPAEHERGLGGWQAEAPVLADLFLVTHGALAALLPVVAGLEIDTGAMRRNLDKAQIGDDVGEAAVLVRAMLSARNLGPP
jgi:3-carboxy-cis,cis-muconate cycloisomerase